MVMETQGKVARLFITSVAGSSAQAVRQMLSQPQSLDAMTRLYPAAQVSEQDGLFSQSYSVTGLNLQKLVAQILTAYYFAFFILMPWYTARDKVKPVPDRVRM